jgi:hypothetical protein
MFYSTGQFFLVSCHKNVQTFLHILCRPRNNRTRVESFARDRHVSLLRREKIYDIKIFYCIGTGRHD